MRTLTVTAAMAIVVGLCVPANAGKYSCSFLNASSVIKQCDIESGAAGYYCQQTYNASMMGTCFVQKSGAVDRLQCVYHNPNKSIAELARDAEKAPAKLTAEQPGFIAGGVTLGAPASLVLTAGYQESTTAPLFQVLCSPNN